MKTIIAAVLSFLFFTAKLLSLSTATDPVLDTDGDELHTGVSYYVQPLINGTFRGGLTWFSAFPDCVVGVSPSPNDRGLPVKISLVRGTGNVVRESKDSIIQFNTVLPRICPPTGTVFQLGDYDSENGPVFVVVGGVQAGNPGTSVRIEKAGDRNGYKLAFCPWTICKDVGLFSKAPLWVLSDKPLSVRFMKANEEPRLQANFA